ncbi:MAG: tetratricopeptide repeat protein [Candidatus Omnitrophica bacterium]|nr:tetratricopeptide repeat protein [Candidatus Omnitrophota bacterium]
MKIDNVLRQPLSVLVGLLALALLLYGQILSAPFVYDDHQLLLGSPLIQSLVAPFQDWQSAGTKLVAFWTFALNYSLGGEYPFGYHLVNVLLHGFNAWFFYLLIRLFFETPRLSKTTSSPDALAVLAAFVFLCHPLQTESVSYVWQRTELLNAFFYLLTLICYLQGRLNKGKSFFMLAAVFFVLGFYSKGMIVSFPLMALLLEDALFDVPREKRIFLRSLGIGIICVQLLFWHIPIIDNFRWKLFYGLMVITGTMITPTHVYTQLDVIGRYIILAVFPFWQNLDHTVPLTATFWSSRTVLGAFMVVFLIAVGVDLWKKKRLMALGIFWFFIVLLPGCLLGGRDPMAEHRLYFPMAGFALLSAVIFVQWFENKKKYAWLAFVFLGLLSLLTLSRNHLWQSPRLLFEDTVRKSPGLARPALMLGTVYLTEKRYGEAEEMLTRAIQLDPQSAESYNNLGFIFLNSGRSMEAEQMFEKAIAARESFVPAYLNLGYFALRIGDVDRAESLFQKALTFEPGNEKVRTALRKAKSFE